jgi:hypothetical protein
MISIVSNGNVNESKYKRNSILNVGFLIYTIIIILFLMMYKNGFIPTVSTLTIGYIGAVIGNVLRIYGMPDMYFTDGTLWGSIKTRFFWAYGPQLIGFFVVLFLLQKRIESWF